MKKTIQELLHIDALVGKLYKKDPTLKETKFGYAYNRFYRTNLEGAIKEYRENLEDIAVEHALEDEKTKALIVDAKGEYSYSKEGRKALLQAQRKAEQEFLNTEIEVKPYISPYTPELNDDEVEAFTGILI